MVPSQSGERNKHIFKTTATTQISAFSRLPLQPKQAHFQDLLLQPKQAHFQDYLYKPIPTCKTQTDTYLQYTIPACTICKTQLLLANPNSYQVNRNPTCQIESYLSNRILLVKSNSYWRINQSRTTNMNA